MASFEISLIYNQEILPISEEKIEKNASLILEYILKNEKLMTDSVLIDYDLSDKTISVDIVITDDEEIQELNNSYRQQNKPTDVLSFALFADSSEEELPIGEEIPLGEVIISIETAKKQADANNIAP